jgi:hypothetical protein
MTAADQFISRAIAASQVFFVVLMAAGSITGFEALGHLMFYMVLATFGLLAGVVLLKAADRFFGSLRRAEYRVNRYWQTPSAA